MRGAEMNEVFDQVIRDYHLTDNVDAALHNPHPTGSLAALLYEKNWIDTVQWHLEDIIRRPDLPPAELVSIKRRIDKSNQARTDIVERIDDHFLAQFQNVRHSEEARLNTETPAWAVDRLSILALKLYHMREETLRADAGADHRAACEAKLSVLRDQRRDLTQSLDELLDDLQSGRRRMKVYRQMKMYNDANLNPALYRDAPTAHPKQ